MEFYGMSARLTKRVNTRLLTADGICAIPIDDLLFVARKIKNLAAD
jgi:hypothetical protein